MTVATKSGLGLACDAAHISIAWSDTSAPRPRWHSLTTPWDGTPASLEGALADLAARAPAANAAHVALVRPLAHTRALALPRMAREALEGVLTRDWSRHVIGYRATPHTVTARPGPDGRWLAAFAPADLLDTIADVASSHGWRSLDVRTADDALAATVRELAPREAREKNCVAVICAAAGPTDVLHLRTGLPWLGRRLLPSATDADIVAFTQTSDDTTRAPVILIGHSTRTTALARALGTQGIRAREFDLGLVADATAVELFAVTATIGAATLPLLTPRAQQVHAARSRAITRWLALATAAALIVALGLSRWRVQRDLSTVQRARADIAAPVSKAMSVRSDLQNASDVAAALAEHEGTASRVSGVLAAISLAIPSSASLTALHIAGDTVTVEGESPRSAAVYQALRAVPALEQVKLAAPLRQERQAGDVAVEHFAFSARLRHSPASSRGATR